MKQAKAYIQGNCEDIRLAMERLKLLATEKPKF